MVNKYIGKSVSQGFTLIEILIVMVLIGILSVILINIIDPESQVERANDGVLSASINKIVLSTESFISAYGYAPDETTFFNYLNVKGVELFGSACSHNFGPDHECLFSIVGVFAPATCDLSHWTGADTNTESCNFRYQARIMNDPGRYRIYVKSHGLSNRVFAYDNKEGGRIFDCPHTIADFEHLTGTCNSR